MFYIVESSKSFYEAGLDLPPVAQRLGFVVLNTRDIGDSLRGKGIDFDEECQVFDIFSYRFAEELLAINVEQCLALPWRISVYTDNGATKIGITRPSKLLGTLDDNVALARINAELEAKLILIVDETRA